MMPIVRSWKESKYLEIPHETLAKIFKRLYIAVRPVNVPVPVIEVNVRHDEYSIVVQEPCYVCKYLGLEVSHIFKNALGDSDVEALIIKFHRRFQEVSFGQIRRWVMYGYVNTIVPNIWAKESHQGCWAATNIKKHAFVVIRYFIYNSRGLLETIVWLAVPQILLAPKILLVDSVAGVPLWEDAMTTWLVVHNHILA